MQDLSSAPQQPRLGTRATLPDLRGVELPAVFTTRKARIQDVDGMSCLINEFAAGGIMLAASLGLIHLF